MTPNKFFYSDNKPIIGESLLLQKVQSRIMQLADSMIPVLLLGETGTGKELFAQAIHYYSPRKPRPFIALNCATIPEDLAESELFGHEKGAFTNAIQLQLGKFELAQGGTIFLDEVGELTPKLQAKLLRVLQEGEIFRVGGKRPIKIDARVICATNIELFQAVIEKRFREDLFYRLRAAQIRLAPLRERKEDLPLLAEHFLEKYNNLEHANITGYSRKALELLTAYSWPGNIRELEYVIWNAVVIKRDGEIQPDDIDWADIPCNGDKIEIDIPAGRINFYEFMETVAGIVAKQLVSVTLARSKGDTTLARENLGLKRWDNVTRKYGINIKEIAQPLQQTDINAKEEKDQREKTVSPTIDLSGLTSRQIKAIQYLKTNHNITAGKYSQLSKTSHRTALREIKELIDGDIISKTGTGRNTSYYLCNPAK